jgi:hypothetical protein
MRIGTPSLATKSDGLSKVGACGVGAITIVVVSLT